MQIKSRITLLFIVLSGFTSCLKWYEPLETVKNFETKNIQGDWYFLAAFENCFPKNSKCVRAKVEVLSDVSFNITNFYSTPDSGIQKQEFIAKLNSEENSAGKFVFEYNGNQLYQFWILEIAPDYSYFVAGNPDRDKFWILSRKNSIKKNDYDDILHRTAKKLFDIRKTLVIPQNCDTTSGHQHTIP